MANSSKPNTTTMHRFSSRNKTNATNNGTINDEQKNLSNVKQLQVLLSVARMRRRSQRQLLVQIEQEQHQQRSLHGSMTGCSVEIPRSCSGTIAEESEGSDEDCFDTNSLSSLNSLSGNTDDS